VLKNLLLSLNLLQFLACLQENFRVGDQVIGGDFADLRLSVALLSAVLLPAMASAADAPATFTPEQEAQIGICCSFWLACRRTSGWATR
jgi:hypothetical protein